MMWGFTLIEALLVTVLFVVGTVSALQASFMGTRMVESTYDELLAIKGVQEYYLEYFKSLDFDDNPLGRLNPTILPKAFPLQQNQTILTYSQNQTFPNLIPSGITGSYSVTDISPASAPNTLKQVTVTVNWTDGNGRPRSSSATIQLSK